MSRKSRVVFKSSHFWWLYSYTSIKMCVRLEKSKSTNEFIYDQACHRQPSNKTSIVCNSLPQWNLSFGTPLFKGQKIWKKMFYIIFVFVTSIEGTPLFLGNEHLLWVAKSPEGGGGTQQMFMGGGSARRPTPHPCFYISFFTKKIPISYTFY